MQLSSLNFDVMTTKVKRSLSEEEGEILTPNKLLSRQCQSNTYYQQQNLNDEMIYEMDHV